jgi:flavin-dependent dehydrogenase
LARSCRTVPGIEAVPHAALCLFEEMGMTHILGEAGALLVEGFENHWRPDEPVLRPGYWIHVDRTKLAEAAVREAARRGAVLKRCRSLPRLVLSDDSVSLVHEGAQLFFNAAIDATGRSAVWSRPILRQGRQVADLFASTAERGGDSRGKVIRFPGHWAYRLGLGRWATAAIVGTDRSRKDVLDATTQSVLGLQSEYSYVGRRPAFPQWCEEPIYRRRVAIGDAAIAHDPISGLGIRFALTSAMAAAAVLNTWRIPRSEANATQYYRQFIAQCLQRHLRFLEELADDSVAPKQISALLPEWLSFSSKTVQAQTQVRGCVLGDEVVTLGDGTFARWIADIDLLAIRDLAAKPVRTSELLQELTRGCNGLSQVTAVLDWCVRHQVLTDCDVQVR